MSNQETRYACPVCLGIQMEKIMPSQEIDLLLDYCSRCGGIWFEQGEVALLCQCHPKAIWTKIQSEHNMTMRCHACNASMSRNAAECPACYWKNCINCPICTQELKIVEYDKFRLDACPNCKGVWFDHAELAEIWNVKVETLKENQHFDSKSEFFLDLLYLDEVVVRGAVAGVELGMETSSEIIAKAPEVAGAIVEGTGELAGSVFEAIAEIISGIFSGF